MITLKPSKQIIKISFNFTKARHKDRDQDICQSVAAVIMMVFQYSSNPAHHCQLLECLMTLKQNILKDVLCVIAYGTSTARSSAAKLLFYYWPTFNANLFDRKNLICKFAGEYNLLFNYFLMIHLGIPIAYFYILFLISNYQKIYLIYEYIQLLFLDPTPFVCQRDMCPNSGNAEAAKVCYDHCISITFANETPPPLYLCIECANEIHREHPNQMFCDILHPMQQVSMVCENKVNRFTILNFIIEISNIDFRIVVPQIKPPYQYVFPPNVPATMEIIQSDIANNAIITDTIIEEEVIT